MSNSWLDQYVGVVNQFEDMIEDTPLDDDDYGPSSILGLNDPIVKFKIV